MLRAYVCVACGELFSARLPSRAFLTSLADGGEDGGDLLPINNGACIMGA